MLKTFCNCCRINVKEKYVEPITNNKFKNSLPKGSSLQKTKSNGSFYIKGKHVYYRNNVEAENSYESSAIFRNLAMIEFYRILSSRGKKFPNWEDCKRNPFGSHFRNYADEDIAKIIEYFKKEKRSIRYMADWFSGGANPSAIKKIANLYGINLKANPFDKPIEKKKPHLPYDYHSSKLIERRKRRGYLNYIYNLREEGKKFSEIAEYLGCNKPRASQKYYQAVRMREKHKPYKIKTDVYKDYLEEIKDIL